MTNATVDHISPEVSRMQRQAKLVRTLVAGTDAMRAAGEAYLPRYPAETAEAYQSRLSRSFLFPATAKTVEDMAGKVFVKPVMLKEDVDPRLKEWAENIDNAGRHLNVFASDIFKDALQTGIGFIFVDAPPAPTRTDGLAPTLADYQATKWRPYLTFVPLENLIGWKATSEGGAARLTQVRFREFATEPDGQWGEREVEQIRVVEPGRWQIYRKNSNSSEWTLHDEGSISLAEIPLAPVYLGRTGYMTAKPPLAALAELNVAHWQSASDQRNILSVARVPILFGAGFADTDKIAVGASSMIRSSDPNAKLGYVEHTGAAIQAGERDLQSLILQMQAMGLQLLIDGQGAQTATGELRDSEKENSPLAMMATALQDAIEGAFAFMMQYVGETDKAGGSVEVNKDFGITGSAAELQVLTQAVLGGKLDTATYLAELKRRNVLADDVDAAVVLHRLEQSPPELAGSNRIDLN